MLPFPICPSLALCGRESQQGASPVRDRWETRCLHNEREYPMRAQTTTLTNKQLNALVRRIQAEYQSAWEAYLRAASGDRRHYYAVQMEAASERLRALTERA